MLDPRRYPKRDDLSAEDEFYAFIERFPSIAEQFKGAKAVRPWTRTGRIQYSAKQVVGERWVLLGQAAGFIDPLYSKGLYISLTSVSVLANLLLEAEETGDYSRAAFMSLEDTTLAFLRANDTLVANSYKSFSNPELWRAYSVLWLLGAYTELVKLMSAKAEAGSRAEYYREVTALRLVGGGFTEFRALAKQLDAVVARTDLLSDTEVGEAVALFQTRLTELHWLPHPFGEILRGKTHLPKRKLGLELLGQRHSFLGTGLYREHFFGKTNLINLSRAFVREKLTYSARALKVRKSAQRG